jgi:hypothetical protein
LKKTLLFISFYRIGTILPRSIDGKGYVITILEQVSKSGFVGSVEKAVEDYDVVVAYAGLDEFDQLAELTAAHPNLRLVACDCDERRRREVMAQLGIEHHVYWTRSCGGMEKMGELTKAVAATGNLPSS